MTEGQTLNATQQVPTILRIADLSRMTVRAEVSEADVGRLQPGTPVYFTTLGGAGVAGQVKWNKFFLHPVSKIMWCSIRYYLPSTMIIELSCPT